MDKFWPQNLIFSKLSEIYHNGNCSKVEGFNIVFNQFLRDKFDFK